jgi:membrane protease YdiL (CAAX protease family)
MMKNLIKRHPIIAFFILAYLITWSLEIPAVFFPGWPGILTFLNTLGPAISAMIVVGMVAGSEGVRQLLEPLRKWRVGINWYFIVLLGPALSMIISIILFGLMGSGNGMSDVINFFLLFGKQILPLILIFFYQFIIIWGEEIGWRGYALPKLQQKMHPIIASVLLGLLWGFWHLPLFWFAGSVHQKMGLPFFILATVGYSLLYTWIYNGTRGSLLMMCLLHAANNTTVTYTMLFFNPIIEQPLFSLAVLALFNLVVIIFAGPKLLWKRDFQVIYY